MIIENVPERICSLSTDHPFRDVVVSCQRDSVMIAGSCKVLVKQDESVYLRPPFVIGIPYHLSVEETTAGTFVVSNHKSAELIASNSPTILGRGHSLLSCLPPQSLAVVSRQHCTLQIEHSDVCGKLIKLTSHSRNGTIVMLPHLLGGPSLLILKRDTIYLMSPRIDTNEYYEVVFATIANSAVCLYHPPIAPVVELPVTPNRWQSHNQEQCKEHCLVKSC
eukprot:TRINITY_DN4809_c0_g1_i1.p1 TRINITY_DN4809_c0_g1~~TRINITY_DN4809_c0_g1_i1.p1  ORF type:complete len:221 (+),score=21.61 TRINITY_DN4809_c0_g1_i1:458-1120(+)